MGALVSKLIARTETRQERMIAKLKAAALGSASGVDSEHAANNDTDATQSGNAKANEPTDGAGGSTSKADGEVALAAPEKKKVKGHGRNGAEAYAKAKLA
jgi:hypothetical protein